MRPRFSRHPLRNCPQHGGVIGDQARRRVVAGLGRRLDPDRDHFQAARQPFGLLQRRFVALDHGIDTLQALNRGGRIGQRLQRMHGAQSGFGHFERRQGQMIQQTRDVEHRLFPRDRSRPPPTDAPPR